MAETESETRFLRKNFKPTQIVRHRGWGFTYPENSIPAYELAGRLGDKYVETDIFFTSDGVAVLHNDETVDRMTNGTGLINTMTLAQIKELNIDTSPMYPNLKVSTLEEFLDVVNAWGMVAWIEIKELTDPVLLDSLNDLFKRKNMEHLVVIISFSLATLQKFRERNSRIELGYVTYDVPGAISQTKKLGNAFIDAYYTVKDNDIATAHQAGVDVAIWGSNVYSDFEKFKKLGASYFTSDIIMEAK